MPEKDYRNILISRFSALGDVAMTIPVVYSLCNSNPHREFIFLTKKLPAKIFINTPGNLKVIGVDTDDYKGIGGLWRLASELKKKYSIDAFADLHGSLRTRILGIYMRLHGVKVASIRKGKRGKHALTRRHNKVMVPLVSTRARYREVFFRLKLPYKESFKNIFSQGSVTPAELLAPIENKILYPTGYNGKRIGIAPFAAHKGKVYPYELMEQVIDIINRKSKAIIYMFGSGSEEIRIIARWAMKYDNIVNMAALRSGFGAEMALMRNLDVMISMDSANMHLASLAGTRVVSVWGATHPFCGFMGWKQRKEDAIQLDMVCRPCSVFGNKPCARGDFYCMYGIAPERIAEAALQ